jgi:transposase InsO family protein
MATKGHKVKSICSLAGISRQGYYKRIRRLEERELLYNTVENIVIENRIERSRSGLRTIYYKENMSSLLGINQFEKEMSLRGYALPPYKTYKKTTDSRGKFYLFDNLIQGQEINNENQVIVGDITYYENQGELYYIFQFTDLFTKEIKGLVGSKTMEGINAEKCLREVFKYNSRNKYNNSLIVHTDAGGQYRSHKYQDMLRKAQIRPSQAKSCFENGLAERINGIVKNEYLIDYDIKSLSHLNKVLKKIKKSVNEVWPSKALGYKTPRQYAETVRQLKAKDRPKKVVKIIE